MNANTINRRSIAILIRIGDMTHHQDHAITFVSFNTIKAIVNKPTKPKLLFDSLDVLILIFPPYDYYYLYNKVNLNSP
jgi:hypothetical protein